VLDFVLCCVVGTSDFNKSSSYPTENTVFFNKAQLLKAFKRSSCCLKTFSFCYTTPQIPSSFNRLFGAICLLHRRTINQFLRPTCFMLISCLACSSILEMEATLSSETLVDFRRATRRSVSRKCRCENLKYYFITKRTRTFRRPDAGFEC
jgi:hypothetical protein